MKNHVMAFTSSRTFRIWDYHISHKQILLRSPRSPDNATNVDIVCQDVDYLDLATSLDGLTITGPSAEDIGRASRATGTVCDPDRVFCFVSGSHRFLVVAANYRVLENELDLFDSSLEYFAADDPERDLGLVLAHSASS